jgi:hypothetical protein
MINEKIRKLQEELEAVKRDQPKKEKEMGIPSKWKRAARKGTKSKNYDKILFVYMRRNGKVDTPKLIPYKDNVVVYNWKAYDIDPRAVWEWGKWKWYFYKEMDRRPVSNLNYKVIKDRGDLTDGDEILIKATMRAVAEGIKKKAASWVLILVGVIIVGIIIALVATGGGTTTTTVVPPG